MRAAAALCCFQMLLGGALLGYAADTVRLEKARFLDKCRGAWAGQMIGVSFGAPTEWAPGVIGFIWMARPNDSELAPWTPDRISNALQQDDVYVEMTFLTAMEKHGIGISAKEAGLAFAASEYDLWHANLFGRENIRRGIMPPRSGYPKHNLHVNDIDFQIEADLFGIVCPGLPRESNRLCDTFGHIMCYGDGVYGGMFVAGMYAAAYFEDSDVRAVVEAGLACIPAQSSYRQCISDVLRWQDEHPGDWLTTWHKVETKWQDNKDCEPYLLSNINANLNGAYVTMGLLYGNGDMGKTVEVATRCGQDSDCNPSTAAGVLGCMKGFKAIDSQWTSGLAAIEDKKFDYTGYSFKTLIPASQRVAEEVIRRVGGSIEADAYQIPRQTPRAPRRLEQWKNDAGGIFEPLTTEELKRRMEATGAAKE